MGLLRSGRDFERCMIPETLIPGARRTAREPCGPRRAGRRARTPTPDSRVESFRLQDRESPMASAFARVFFVLLTLGGARTSMADAQLSAPNAAGVSMGHLHFVVRDVAATKSFWQKLGGEPVMLGT